MDQPLSGSTWLSGPAGAGKTTAAVARLLHLLDSGVPAGSILVLTPQRTLAEPYFVALRSAAVKPGGEVTVLTLGGLAQRMVQLFWPLIAAEAGFATPDREPTFLTLETAQYFMAGIVGPLLDDGYFDGVVIGRNRLFSQIIDNLNKAAVVGFPHTEIAARLISAWVGESSQIRVYQQAQVCAERFRSFCLEHNLLDFSLQYELFVRHLWPNPLCSDYLRRRFSHLIVDNLEEDTPIAHDIIRAWLPDLTSALLVSDDDAGYRIFLGADPAGARAVGEACDRGFRFESTQVMSPQVAALSVQLGTALGRSLGPIPAEDVIPALDFAPVRYYPEMLEWVGATVVRLVREESVPPREIAVLAPFLTGSLRFSLANHLQREGIPVRSHRPSRSLREEPVTLCLLTLASLCHPDWGIVPTQADLTYALMQAIDGLDLVRAQLLVDVVYRIRGGRPELGSFSQLEPEMQSRITFLAGGRYEGLRAWIQAHTVTVSGSHESGRRNRQGPPALDHFLSRLFGELLSQYGYRFHEDLDAGEVTAVLIESARKFKEVAVTARGSDDPQATRVAATGREFVRLVRDGVIAAQYIRRWRDVDEDAVFLAPAHTFLLGNRAVDHQFWLDVGSSSWWERLAQPLTHPYVLSRRWEPGRPWTDADEFRARQDALSALAVGLLRRCRVRVHLGISEMGEFGTEPRGPLLQAMQGILKRNAYAARSVGEGADGV